MVIGCPVRFSKKLTVRNPTVNRKSVVTVKLGQPIIG